MVESTVLFYKIIIIWFYHCGYQFQNFYFQGFYYLLLIWILCPSRKLVYECTNLRRTRVILVL